MLNMMIEATVLVCASLVVFIGAVAVAVGETSPFFRVGIASLSALVLVISCVLAGHLRTLAAGAGL